MSETLVLALNKTPAPTGAALEHHRQPGPGGGLDRPRFGRHVLPCVVDVCISELAS